MSTIPFISQGFATLASIRAQAQSRPDFVNNPFMTTTEWNNNINQAFQELYSFLVTSYGEDYFLTNYQFQTLGPPVYQYPLPYDFTKLTGVEWQRNYPQNDQNITLNNFMFRNRNDYNYIVGGNCQQPDYRITNNQIWFKPAPQNGMWMQLWYVPRAQVLAECGTITLLTFGAGKQITMTTNVPLTAGGVLVPQTFTTASQNANTNATALAEFINLYQSQYLTAVATNNVVTMTLVNPGQPFSISFTNVDPTFQCAPGQTWTNLVDGVMGFENYVIVRAAQMALMKEASLDVWQAMGQELAEIKQRVIDDAVNRNAGDPETTTISGQGTATGGGGMLYGGGWGLY